GDGEGRRVRKLPPAGPIRADEIGVAELADRLGAIGLAAAPEVAPGEAAEDRGPSGVRTLALERVVDLLHRVRHAWVAAWYLAGSGTPASSNPLSLSRQASQRPHAAPS